MDGFTVDPNEVRSHAAAVEEFGGRADVAKDAGAHLTSLNDAYGLFCQPFGQMLVEPQQQGTDAIARAAESLHEHSKKLDETAQAYEEFEQQVVEMLEEILDSLDDLKEPN